MKTKQGLTAYRHQVGAIPVRQTGAGLAVLLITSRDSRRWIIPKGWPMKGRKDYEAAAQEAIEEAGITGRIKKWPVGSYTYQKRFIDHVEPCRVVVYRMTVDDERSQWREVDQRERRWAPIEEAADLVSEPSLANLLLQVGRGQQPEKVMLDERADWSPASSRPRSKTG